MGADESRELHVKYLECAALLMQEPVLHDALLAVPVDTPWRLDAVSLRRLPERFTEPFRTHELAYCAARVTHVPDYEHYVAPTSIPLKIWAADDPTVSLYTFNALDSTPLVREGEAIDTSFIA